MCATGMELGDEELVWLSIRGFGDAPTVASIAASASSAASSLAAGGVYREDQHSYSSSERAARVGPCTSRPYSDSLATKTNSVSGQTLGAFQGQAVQSFSPASTMLPKTVRRQGLWSPPNTHRNFMNSSGGNLETEQQVVTALPDQSSTSMPDLYRASGGLARYHSAPSSFFANLADLHQDGALSTFFSDGDLTPLNDVNDSLETMETEQSANSLYDDKFMLNPKRFERGNPQLGGSGGGLVPPKSLQSMYKHSMEVLLENPAAPQMPSSTPLLSTSQMSSSGLSSSLVLPSSLGLPQKGSSQTGQQMSILGNINFSCGLESFGAPTTSTPPSNRSNALLRQSSSPAGLLAQLSIDTTPQLKAEKQCLASPLAQSPEDSLSGGTSDENTVTPGMGGWEDATSYVNWANDTNGRKRFRENNIDFGDIVLPSEISGRASLEQGPAPGSLIRHMSLPTPKTKSSVLPEDILSVPCRIRAKRGCATHPRSIAERVRRTKISERMKKLQELVPNMDKAQTNTADMLDEAVEYVKQLQRQVQELTEIQAKCNGSCHQDHKKHVS